MFSVCCDEKFFERTKHGSMKVEVWQRGNGEADSIIGTVKVPLHQFHIAFYDINVRRHVFKQKVKIKSKKLFIFIDHSNVNK